MNEVQTIWAYGLVVSVVFCLMYAHISEVAAIVLFGLYMISSGISLGIFDRPNQQIKQHDKK